jgi:hypothetical protein
MSQDHNHLSHATRECEYRVVFTPKYRKKVYCAPSMIDSLEVKVLYPA